MVLPSFLMAERLVQAMFAVLVKGIKLAMPRQSSLADPVTGKIPSLLPPTRLFLLRNLVTQVDPLPLARQGSRLMVRFTRLSAKVALVQEEMTPGSPLVFIPFLVVVSMSALRLPMSFRSESLIWTPPLPFMAEPNRLISRPKYLSRLLPQQA